MIKETWTAKIKEIRLPGRIFSLLTPVLNNILYIYYSVYLPEPLSSSYWNMILPRFVFCFYFFDLRNYI